MDTGNMTFGEILFHARWGIIGGVMFLVFMAAFTREVAHEIALSLTERRRVARRHAMGAFMPDMMLGATMTDGGEPIEDADKPAKPEP
jgi:hypothetical protein